jgi:hypothetical protein
VCALPSLSVSCACLYLSSCEASHNQTQRERSNQLAVFFSCRPAMEPCPTICNGRWRLQCAGRRIASARLDAISPAHRERSVQPSQIARVGTAEHERHLHRLIGCEVQMIRRATVRRKTLPVSRMSRLHGSYRSRSWPHSSATSDKCVAHTGRDLRHPSPSISAPAPQQRTTPSCDDAKQRARNVLLRRGDAPGASCPFAFGRLPSGSALFGALRRGAASPRIPCSMERLEAMVLCVCMWRRAQP